MPHKMPRRLVALSASAVATIYMAGVLSTRTAAESAAVSAGADAAVVPTPGATLTSARADPTSIPAVPAVVGASATATPVAPSTPAATATATTPSYADGTYSGTGTSRFGNVSVSVTMSGGKIASVQITRVTTTFPVSRIASLPAQVIQKQTANVNTVTGATYSSQAFKQAVQQALSQALAV
jgi:uncharacterized protein with FMN-binding domain